MQITGRVTADAMVKQLDSGKQVVSFSIADNESYTPKGSSTPTQITTFFRCSYWIGTGVAEVLKKGATVMLDGRVSARAYTTSTGDTGTSLDFHTNRIRVLAYAKGSAGTTQPAITSTAAADKPTDDDLPF